jgi:hypothetical protein
MKRTDVAGETAWDCVPAFTVALAAHAGVDPCRHHAPNTSPNAVIHVPGRPTPPRRTGCLTLALAPDAVAVAVAVAAPLSGSADVVVDVCIPLLPCAVAPLPCGCLIF